jgi:hypothetical protein
MPRAAPYRQTRRLWMSPRKYSSSTMGAPTHAVTAYVANNPPVSLSVGRPTLGFRDDDSRRPADDCAERADAEVLISEPPAEVPAQTAGAATLAHVEHGAEQSGPEDGEADQQLDDDAAGIARSIQRG